MSTVEALLPNGLLSLDQADPNFLIVVVATVVCGLLALAYLYQLLTARPPKYLPTDDFAKVPLIEKEVLSHDTRRFTFALPVETHVLGLPTGQHVSLKFTTPEGKTVQRSYTPVTDDSTVGKFSLVIKVYRPAPPKFPQGGLMSQHLDDLKLGETILMRGPKGHLNYTGKGKFEVKPLGKPLEHRACQQIGMVAGGTGITPMLQILHAIFRNPSDQTCVKLVYANQTPDDILVREELEALARNHPTRFSLWYTVDRLEGAKAAWNYDTGFVTKEMIQKHLVFDNSKKTQFFMCGPPPMIKFALVPSLTELGYTEKDWAVF